MDVLGEVAKQGLGYLLFAGSLLVVFTQNKEIKRINEQRIVDLNTYKDIFITTSKDLLNAIANQSKSIDSVVEILQNGKFRQ